jgi:putative mRNA 3-end processing factor
MGMPLLDINAVISANGDIIVYGRLNGEGLLKEISRDGVEKWTVSGDFTGRKLFTGDINTINTRLVWKARPVKTDVLIMESTYAGREHPDRREHEMNFLNDVAEVIDNGGQVILPSFAVGRTQEMMMTLAGRGYDIWVDGMGKGISFIYLENPDYIRSQAKLKKAIKGVSMVRGKRDRERASRDADVIITTSGMMDGGPVLSYVERIKNDPKSAIFITGYQVEGTNGRKLLDTGMLDISGVDEKIEAQIKQYDFSAHAGHSELIEFARACDPETIVLMHGDQRDVLAKDLSSEFNVLTPVEGEDFEI